MLNSIGGRASSLRAPAHYNALKKVLDMAASYAMLGVMIPTYPPSDATALELIRTHNFCTARLVDEFLSMRECHQFISPSLTVDDSIRDVAWDIIRDGVKISLGDAIKVVNHSVALYTSKMEVA